MASETEEVAVRDHETYRQAYSALVAFSEQFAAPILALREALKKITDVDTALMTAERQLVAVKDEHARWQTALEQAKVDRETLLNTTQHERDVLAADADRALQAHKERVQLEIDALFRGLVEQTAAIKAQSEVLDAQIAQRKEEQRLLDAKIQQQRIIVADLTLSMVNAGVDLTKVQ